MPSSLILDLVIISWQGFGDKARHIAQTLLGQPNLRVSVIYSNALDQPEAGPGRWVPMVNAAYFGRKFARALHDFEGDAMLVVQADASSDNWPALVERCRERFQTQPEMGLWAPRVDYTPWQPQRVDIRQIAGEALTQVAHTDAIVLGLSKQVLQRLRQLDYSRNNIGWGIDWIAICHCYTQGLAVLREDGLKVAHPASRGYDTREATRQWLGFMAQMSEAEQAMFEILKRYTAEKKKSHWARLKTSLAKRRARR